jgi:hypothetical protein
MAVSKTSRQKKRSGVARKQMLTLRLNYENYGKPELPNTASLNHENSLVARPAGRCHLLLLQWLDERGRDRSQPARR